MKNMILKILFSLLCFLSIAIFVPYQKVVEVTSELKPVNLLIAFVLISISVFLSSVRIKSLLTTVDPSIKFYDVHRINILSQLVGLFVFNTIGQMTFRSIYSGKYTSNPQRLAFLTLVEKLIAMITLLILAMIGSFTIVETSFGKNISLTSQLIVAFASILVIICVYAVLLTSGQRHYLKKILRQMLKLKIREAALISVTMHLFMLASYVILARSLLPEINIYALAGIFSIVMLGAAIPISFAGWGLRELSSGFVFAYLGLNVETGIVVAFMIGILSILSLALNASIVSLSKDNTVQLNNQSNPANGDTKYHFEKAIGFFGLLIMPIFIGVQMRIPTNTNAITVNLADPLAIGLAITFISIWFKRNIKKSIWRVEGFSTALSLFVLMIVLGWIYGFFTSGFSDWATYNRLFGLIVVFSYLFSGVAIIFFLGQKSLSLLVRIFILATLVYFCLYLFLWSYLGPDTIENFNWYYRRFNGFMQNRNALAFSLCLFLCLTIIVFNPLSENQRAFFIGLLLGFVILSFSRTGMICAGITILISVCMKYIDLRLLGKLAVVSITVIFIALLFWELPHYLANHSGSWPIAPTSKPQNIEHLLIIDSDRIQSYLLALKMWLENPIFGAGLGVFISTYEEGFSRPLTIHNTTLWVLAEMGIVGLLLFLPLPIIILRHLVRNSQNGLNAYNFAMLLIFVNFFIFSMAHEVLYQRTFWLIAGLICVNYINLQKTYLANEKFRQNTYKNF